MKECEIIGCKDKMLARGWCNKHYRAWRRYGHPLIKKGEYPNLQVHIKAGIIEKDGHWIWQKSKVGGKEYGGLESKGRKLLAHRASYEAFVGEIPEGMNVCHTCDIRACVNPAHLFLGTQQDNQTDMVKKDRQAKGEAHGRKKLSEKNVIVIKHMLKEGIHQRKIAKRYGLTQAAISLINVGVNWSHVQI